MHDWILVDITYKWEDGGSCKFSLRDRNSNSLYIEARKVSELIIPRNEDWGPSSSINKVRDSFQNIKGKRLEIEMQSGDVIVICADEIDIPDSHGISNSSNTKSKLLS